jgi:hypothetical protein
MLQICGRFFRKKLVSQKTQVNDNSGKPWHENIFALNSIAFSKTGYTFLRDVSSYLENDVIPVGYLWEKLLGYEFGEYRNRLFAGTHYSRADKFGSGSYLYVSSALETYITTTGTEQSILAIEPLLISPLKQYGALRYRYFSNNNIIIGSKRYPKEKMNLSSLSGYRGNWNLQGNKILRSCIENDMAIPYTIWGFKIGLFTFRILPLPQMTYPK